MGPISQDSPRAYDGRKFDSPVASRRRVLVVGDHSPPEFQPAIDGLRLSTHKLHFLRDIDDAGKVQEIVEPGFAPDLVLFLENRPGELLSSQVERVLQKWPLATSVVLLGSWCEGEMRTGRPLAGVARLPWHRWEAAFGEFWECFDDPKHPWRLPRTRTLAEELLAEGEFAARRPELARRATCGGPLIAVDAAESDAFDSWRVSLSSAGYAVARWRNSAPREVEGAAALIWDDPGWTRSDLVELKRCVELSRGTPVIAILGMLRWEDWVTARSWGVAVTIAKPLRLPDLLWHLRRQCGIARSE